MPNYRRLRLTGATYFFTVNLRDRSSTMLVDRIGVLRRSVAVTRRAMPFAIDAWVVMPNHLHCLWTLPADDSDFPARWRSIKLGFSFGIGRGGVWQRGYWEHAIRDERDFAAHLDYVHFNPIKHGYATHPAEWPYSSFRACVAKGLYPEDWLK
jgi:putative transposase